MIVFSFSSMQDASKFYTEPLSSIQEQNRHTSGLLTDRQEKQSSMEDEKKFLFEITALKGAVCNFLRVCKQTNKKTELLLQEIVVCKC